jgi:SNF family Na+-dependent transporter
MNNSGEGIDMYLKGEHAQFTPKKALEEKDIWINAVALVFFSLSLGVGVMTSYASYSPVQTPIIRDSLIIAITNTLTSFFAGFFIFGCIGYLWEKVGPEVQAELGGTLLVYGWIPYALSEGSGPNAWSAIYFLCIFLLGIDSSISYVEVVVTTIYDTEFGQKTNRLVIAGACCLVGFLLSLMFTTNFAQNMIDTTDYFLGAYFVIFLAIMECFCVGWVFDVKNKIKDNEENARPIFALFFGFWGGLCICGILGFWIIYKYNYVAFLIFLVSQIVNVIYTWKISGMSFGTYYETILMCGVYRIGQSITKLSNNGQRSKWMGVFEAWWGLSIKFVIPVALTWMLFMSIKFMMEDGKDAYEVNDFKWYFVGMLFPIVGLIVMCVPAFKPIQSEEDIINAKVARKTAFHNPIVSGMNFKGMIAAKEAEMAQTQNPVVTPNDGAEKLEDA